MRSPVLLAALAAAALAIPAAATAQEAPAPIAIDDPMLAPPLPASRAVASWQEALAIVRERSTDLRNAQANVDRAEAQQRTALAGLLPTITGSTTGTYNFDNDIWYRIRLRVSDAKIEAWINGEQVIDLGRAGHRFSVWYEQEAARPFGISTWDTGAALREIRVRRLSSSE